MLKPFFAVLIVTAGLCLIAACANRGGKTARPGMTLRMPPRADGAMPVRLTETGAFADVQALRAAAGFLPYDLNVPFWSDGAVKKRWMSVPQDLKIAFSPTGEWKFPDGTVFVKHFALAIDETRPELLRPLETRLLVRDSTGGVYGVTYKWRPDGSDADLLTTNFTESIVVATATGTRTQTWYYPSRADCLTCHTPVSGGVLGVNTRQLNRAATRESRQVENQLSTFNRAGIFNPSVSDHEIDKLPKLAPIDAPSRSIEDRARSYLDANCANCHRPGGTVASMDLRYDIPLSRQGLVNGRVLIDDGIDGARAIAPNDRWRSIVLHRMRRLDGTKMPPLAHSELDREGLAVIEQWIGSLPGRTVLAPPAISPQGGRFAEPVEATLAAEPGAIIRYTLDGSVPTTSDAVYDRPIRMTNTTVLRGKAFRPGHTRSITAQAIFEIGP